LKSRLYALVGLSYLLTSEFILRNIHIDWCKLPRVVSLVVKDLEGEGLGDGYAKGLETLPGRSLGPVKCPGMHGKVRTGCGTLWASSAFSISEFGDNAGELLGLGKSLVLICVGVRVWDGFLVGSAWNDCGTKVIDCFCLCVFTTGAGGGRGKPIISSSSSVGENIGPTLHSRRERVVDGESLGLDWRKSFLEASGSGSYLQEIFVGK